MRKSIAIFGLFIIFFLIPFFLLSRPKEKKFDKSEGLKREIRLINLLKGLELSSEKMEMILTRARETEKLRLEFESALHLQ
jgi:hypothetical protein